jgi:hypothetical protein
MLSASAARHGLQMCLPQSLTRAPLHQTGRPQSLHYLLFSARLRTWALAASLQAHSPSGRGAHAPARRKKTGFAVAATVQRWLQAQLADATAVPQLNRDQLSSVCALTTEHRKHLNNMRESASQPGLAAELLSMQALAAWIQLCLAHRAAAAEWPQLLHDSLPVYADDLRRLVLSSEADVQTALRVSQYLSAHGGGSPIAFSTAALDDTWHLADAFVQSSSELCRLLKQERELASEQEEKY